MKKALITGVSGQDGAYLAKFLLKKNYKIIGTTKSLSRINKWRLKKLNIEKKIIYAQLNLHNKKSIDKVFEKFKFDEFYNFAGHSFVATSFKNALNTANNTGIGVVRILENIRKKNNKIKFYQATSSEIFGGSKTTYQNERSSYNPKNPYAISKLFAHLITGNYREYYNIFAVSGILFNHESPLRGEEFLTRKIAKGLIKIINGKQKFIEVGNLDSKRDWGYAKEFVEIMWKMMQQKKPEDFVISFGKAYSVKYFIDLCLRELNIKGKWIGKNEKRKFVTKENKTIIKVNPKYIRKKDYKLLIGDSTKAKKKLNWHPKINIKKLVKIMINEEKKLDSEF